LKWAEQAALQAHKAESLGRMAGGIAHDFNNVLVSILGQISLVQHSLPADNALRTHLNKAVRAAERAADLAQQMLIYSGRGHFETRPLNLNRLIQDYLALLRATTSSNIQFRDSLDSHLPMIQADPSQMHRLIVNLLENSIEAIGDRPGMVMITTGARTIGADSKPVQLYAGAPLPAGRYVTLRVQDNGAGMDMNTSVKIFDPFFTTKPGGRGLGLAAVLGIVQSYRGGLQVHSQAGKGSILTLFFPTGLIEPDPSALATSSPSTPAAIRNAATILVIDDEDMVREAVTDILEAEGYYVLNAADGATGIALYRKRMDDIALVLLDLSMPGMNGEQTLDVLKKINPKVRVLISSGCSEQEVLLRFKREQIEGFVRKPYSADTLVSAIWRHLA
jgi:CheY-like chemotaxis protein